MLLINYSRQSLKAIIVFILKSNIQAMFQGRHFRESYNEDLMPVNEGLGHFIEQILGCT
jgi:hypothetical protein